MRRLTRKEVEMAIKCPTCGKKINIAFGFIPKPITFECDCGSKVTVARGLFRDKVVSFERPVEAQSPLKGSLSRTM